MHHKSGVGSWKRGRMAPTPHTTARAALVLAGLTIREAAEHLEVSADVLSRWLAARERMPDARRRQLAELLGWPLDDLAALFDDDRAPEAQEVTTHGR